MLSLAAAHAQQERGLSVSLRALAHLLQLLTFMPTPVLSLSATEFRHHSSSRRMPLVASNNISISQTLPQLAAGIHSTTPACCHAPSTCCPGQHTTHLAHNVLPCTLPLHACRQGRQELQGLRLSLLPGHYRPCSQQRVLLSLQGSRRCMRHRRPGRHMQRHVY